VARAGFSSDASTFGGASPADRAHCARHQALPYEGPGVDQETLRTHRYPTRRDDITQSYRAPAETAAPRGDRSRFWTGGSDNFHYVLPPLPALPLRVRLPPCRRQTKFLKYFLPVTRTAPPGGRRAGPLLLRPTSTTPAGPECRRRSAIGLGAMEDAKDLDPVTMVMKADAVVADPQTEFGRVDSC